MSAPGTRGKTLLGQLASSMDRKGTDPIPAIVAELGTTPALLAVDDIHTYSTEDIYGISQLMREILTRKFQPVILVLTSSTVRGRVEPIVTGATTGTELELLPIRPIDTQAAISLVKDLGISGALCSVIGRRLHAEYYGSPGTIREQINALIEAGWLEATALGLRGRRSIEEFRRGELPIPDKRRSEASATLGQLDDVQIELVELLALLTDQPEAPCFFEPTETHKRPTKPWSSFDSRK